MRKHLGDRGAKLSADHHFCSASCDQPAAEGDLLGRGKLWSGNAIVPEENVFRVQTPSVGRTGVEVKFDQPPAVHTHVRLDLRVFLRAIQHAPMSAMREFEFCDGVSLVQFKFGQWI